MVFARTAFLFACACIVVAGCEDDVVTEVSQIKPGLLDTCAFEATLPAEATFEDISRQFAVNRQFCSWASFAERKLVGVTFLTTPDLRKPSEMLSGVPNATSEVCDVQSMLDAGWKLKPRTLEIPEQFGELCGHYGIQMSLGAIEAFGEHILDLPQLCFEPVGWHDYRDGDRLALLGLGTSLSMRWTLPARFHRVDADTGTLRLWFDGSPDAAWADNWSGHVIAAALTEGIELVQKPCVALGPSSVDINDI